MNISLWLTNVQKGKGKGKRRVCAVALVANPPVEAADNKGDDCNESNGLITRPLVVLPTTTTIPALKEQPKACGSFYGV